MSAPSFTGSAAPAAPNPRGKNARLKHAGKGVAIGISVLAVSAIWLWNRGAEVRAVRHLPEAERKALYERTLGTLRSPCAEAKRSDGLVGFCKGQAEFIVEFPECDDACLALARHYLGSPSR